MGKDFKASKESPASSPVNPLTWLSWVYKGVDAALYAGTKVFSGQRAVAAHSAEDPVSAVVGPHCHRTHRDFTTEPLDHLDGLTTMFEVYQRSYTQFADKKCLGTRKYLGEHQPEGARFALKKFGETDWLTYQQVKETAVSFGAGLRALGCEPLPKGLEYEATSGPHTLLIYEDTSAPWLMAAHGAISQSIVIATSYATLGIESVANAIQETNATAILCNYAAVKKMHAVAAQCPSLKTIIYTRHYVVPDAPSISDSKGSVKVMSFDEVVALGAAKPVPLTPPTADSLALLMYTSGSTGKPKGVMIKHRAIVATVASMVEHVGTMTTPGEETYLSYLPAAHILEFSAESSFFALGGTFGFACPRTISSKGACRERPDGTISKAPGWPYPPGAIQEFRPTFMAAVPKIWDILKKGVEEQIGKASPAKQFVFQLAFSTRAQAVDAGADSPLSKALVFNKVSEMMGGRLKAVLSGGGAISSEVQSFIRTCMCVPMLQGYGLTETTSSGCVQEPDDVRDGIVGKPLAGVQIKLEPCPEVLDKQGKPYLGEKDTMHCGTPCAGRGEVCIRGPVVSSGYYKQPDKTAEAWDADGWFHTGDIGLWTPDGCLQLIDRLKNLIKLKGGEYVAIEQMEAIYTSCVYVNGTAGGIMCHASGEMDRPVALVQVDPAKVKAFAKTQGLAGSVEELCEHPAVVKEVLTSLQAVHGTGGLSPIEKLCAVTLLAGNMEPTTIISRHSAWQPGAGLTASNKLDRKAVLNALEDACITPLMKDAAK